MSPLLNIDAPPDQSMNSMSPLRGQQAKSLLQNENSLMVPTESVQFIQTDQSIHSLMDFLQVTPHNSVAPTPVGSPVGSPRRSVGHMEGLHLPPLIPSSSHSQTSHEIQQHFRSSLQSPLSTTNPNEAQAAFLPPEFQLEDNENFSGRRRLAPSTAAEEQQHRGKSPFVPSNLLCLSDFSLKATSPSAHIECIVTEPAVEALNLLEAEIQRMMRIIRV